jgi:hypothetical protein
MYRKQEYSYSTVIAGVSSGCRMYRKASGRKQTVQQEYSFQQGCLLKGKIQMGLCFQSGLAAAIPHKISTGHKRINPVNLLRWCVFCIHRDDGDESAA